MDKNRIEGRHGAMSWHNTAKSSGVPVEVNAAAVQRSNVPLPGEICRSRRPSRAVASEAERLERGRQKSAEAIVVEETSRSANEHSKVAGVTHPTKGRTSRAATNDRRGGTPYGLIKLRRFHRDGFGSMWSRSLHRIIGVMEIGWNRRIRSRMSGGVGPRG